MDKLTLMLARHVAAHRFEHRVRRVLKRHIDIRQHALAGDADTREIRKRVDHLVGKI